MTDGLEQLMVNAGLNLLRTTDGITPALNIIQGPVPNPTPPLPYVVVWTSVDWPPDDPGRDSLDNLNGSAQVRWFCHIVAENDISWWAIAQRVRTQLLNKRPAIAGMQPGLIRMEDGTAPPGADEVLGTAVLTAVRVFTLRCDT